MDKLEKHALLTGIIFFVPIIIFYSYVFWQMWHWFIVPLGVMKINLAHSYGISSLVTLPFCMSMVKVQESHKKLMNRASNDELFSTLAYAVSMPLITLIAGFAAQSFM